MIKKFITVIVVLATSVISAQRNNASPYSIFGIGDKFSQHTVEQNALGGLGVAMQEYNYLNFSNPASLAGLRVATYALGGETSFLTLNEQDKSQSGNSTSLRYIALGFPIGEKAGFSVGLQPLSSVGYSILNEIYNGDDLAETTLYTGSGGINRLYASFGIKVYDQLALGIEAAFNFGNIENDVVNSRSDVTLATKYKELSNFRGGQIKLGAQYKTDLSKNLQLSTGVAVKLVDVLKQTGTEQMYSLSYGNSGTEFPRDTLFNKSIDKSIKSPLTTSVGFGLGKDGKWYVGVNSEYQPAIEESDVDLDNNSYRYENAMRTSIGGYYIPKINSISSYWDRVTYRGGVRFEKTGVLVDGTRSGDNFTSINDFGINLGLGLPLPKQISTLNLGFEYGQRGTTNNNLIKESYYNLRLSLSLNSINWFKQRKID